MKSGPRIDTVEDKQHGSQIHLSPTYENNLDQPSTLEAPKDVKLELGSQRKPVFEVRGKTTIDAQSDSGKETPGKSATVTQGKLEFLTVRVLGETVTISHQIAVDQLANHQGPYLVRLCSGQERRH